MGTDGSYGIIHDGHELFTFQNNDMGPGGYGRDLAREAIVNAERASEFGSASLDVRFCQYEPDGGGIAGMRRLQDMINKGAPVRDLLHNERFHYCFHRPGATFAAVTAENVSRVPSTLPSFLTLVSMEEVYGAIHSWSMYWYTWLTSPRNLFVVSTQKVTPPMLESGKGIAMWYIESRDERLNLADLLNNPPAFEDFIRESLDW